MKLELAKFIIQACENADTFFEDEESMPTIRENYSYQHGKEPTTAIVCKSIMPVMAAIACEIEEVDMNEFWGEVDLSHIRHFQMDSMGHDVVIY
jgi:hypothetical protein